MIIIFAGTGISLFVMELFGKFSDKYGSYRTLCISTALLVLVPILWIAHHSIFYLVLIPSTISGIGWAGLHLTEKNLIYENVSPQKRGLAVSYYNMLWGLGIFFGAGLSALLIKFLDTSFVEPMVFIFMLGTLTRAITAIWWLKQIKEVKKTKKFSASQAFNEIIFKQAAPTIHEEIHDIIHIKKYITTK
jgi:MFS family permease